MRFHVPVIALSLSVALGAGCASSGPVIPTPPAVEVASFDSVLITPDGVDFVAKVRIDNRMRAALKLQEVVYGADLHGRSVLADSFSELQPMKSRGKQTVTLPFQVSMKEILDSAVDILADEELRVTFSGKVLPVGFEPVPFSATKTIPPIRIPLVDLDGADGSPLEGRFRVFLGIENGNAFPIDLESVDSWVELNGKRYALLRTPGATQVPAKGKGKLLLAMEQTTGKTLSMIVNVARAGAAKFAVGGSVRWNTPHGVILLPLQLESTTN